MKLSCHKRLRYQSQAVADNAIKLLRMKPTTRPMWSYFCRQCRLWHLTSKRPKGAKRDG